MLTMVKTAILYWFTRVGQGLRVESEQTLQFIGHQYVILSL